MSLEDLWDLFRKLMATIPNKFVARPGSFLALCLQIGSSSILSGAESKLKASWLDFYSFQQLATSYSITYLKVNLLNSNLA